jgi:hypothetical protein
LRVAPQYHCFLLRASLITQTQKQDDIF